MVYIRKGGWGGDRRKNNGRKKGQPCKKTAYAKAFHAIHFKSTPSTWRPRVLWGSPECPICDNANSEFITELRSMFYHCEKCGHNWDSETSK